MAKKRKASGRGTSTAGPKDVDPKDARLGPITSYRDVADSEDEFLENRDTIMFDDEPETKRRRQDEEDMEFSDEEVFAGEDSEDEAEAVQEDGGTEDEDDNGNWGASRKDYYNTDNIETEADALAEEVEAKRMQQKKLSKMTEEDFMFNEDDWLAGDDVDVDDEPIVTEVLQEVEVTDEMGAEERLRLLQTRYPEFEPLAKELQDLQPVLMTLGKEAEAAGAASLEMVKYWTLGCYIAALTSYFAILTSPARDKGQSRKTLDPTDLRDHDVMETLMSCRKAWTRVKDLRSRSTSSKLQPLESASEALLEHINGDTPMVLKEDLPTAATKTKRLKKKVNAKDAKKAKEIEDGLADLYNLPIGGKRRSKTTADKANGRSDFGEEEALDARTAEDKAARKKTLKFYTSQIVQKANKRSGAGRDAGGDMDIPHRERLRDRQARLVQQAEKRGSKGSKFGADLGGDDSDDNDKSAANAMRNDEDGYYDMVANKTMAKKDAKTARYAALAEAAAGDRVVEKDEVGEDGKRKITYAIEKNKGLTPKRRKSVRNPRVKKREQYEAKKKKLGSMKSTWKGGEPKGGYQGELSGVNIGVVRSRKL